MYVILISSYLYLFIFLLQSSINFLPSPFLMHKTFKYTMLRGAYPQYGRMNASLILQYFSVTIKAFD